jgi:hypothetical protein
MLILLRTGYPMKKSTKAPRSVPSKAAGERTADLETKPAVVSAFIQFRSEFGETELGYFPTSQGLCNWIDLGSKCYRI